MNQPAIKLQAKKYSKEYKAIFNAIKKYDRIVVFRHSVPDYDAMGTQMGFVTWLKDNFPNKEIHFVGDNHVVFTPRIFPETESLNEGWFSKPFLAFIVDVGNKSRIADPRFEKAEFSIRLDHHPKVEDWGNISIIDTKCSAASELVASMCFSFKNCKMSQEAAKYFYTGIAGDSGRFQYSSTSVHTFAVASALLETGINISKIYNAMYLKKIEDLNVTAYILNHYEISPDGIAYYVLSNEIQTKLHITTERGKENVNLFSNIEGINAWCSITEDSNPKDPCYRVSIRSKEKAINGVAAMFEGGGHAQASGAKLKTLDDLPRMIEELGKLFK